MGPQQNVVHFKSSQVFSPYVLEKDVMVTAALPSLLFMHFR